MLRLRLQDTKHETQDTLPAPCVLLAFTFCQPKGQHKVTCAYGQGDGAAIFDTAAILHKLPLKLEYKHLVIPTDSHNAAAHTHKLGNSLQRHAVHMTEALCGPVEY